MLEAGASVLRLAGAAVDDPKGLALRVWLAMEEARPGVGRPSHSPELLERALKERLAGTSVSTLRRRYNLSGSVCQRLRELKP